MARILVVEDYPAILTMVRLMLMSAGHEVVTAVDGKAGLGMVGRHKPDLVLVDVDLPLLDGVTMCGLMKRDPGAERIPVLLMTGRLCADVLARASKAGALGVLAKPFARAQLLAEVDRAVEAAARAGKRAQRRNRVTGGSRMREFPR